MSFADAFCCAVRFGIPYNFCLLFLAVTIVNGGLCRQCDIISFCCRHGQVLCCHNIHHGNHSDWLLRHSFNGSFYFYFTRFLVFFCIYAVPGYFIFSGKCIFIIYRDLFRQYRNGSFVDAKFYFFKRIKLFCFCSRSDRNGFLFGFTGYAFVGHFCTDLYGSALVCIEFSVTDLGMSAICSVRQFILYLCICRADLFSVFCFSDNLKCNHIVFGYLICQIFKFHAGKYRIFSVELNHILLYGGSVL